MDTIESRLRRLEDREAIRDLVIRYGFVVDDHDHPGIRLLFTDDAVLRTASGRVKGRGIDEVADYFAMHLQELGPTNHVTHGVLIEFDESVPTQATGTVASHAEVWRNGRPMLTAIRYHDTYREVDGGWRFAERIQSYMYFLDVGEYPEGFGSRLRVRADPDRPQPADWPLPFT